ncbi:B12-binding domain-containing radical SAM protein [Geojedonia litorea]|uniref:B12-binding domain-containing radical SAM protein n=1 Tax=Geojedonia litorea TaxID=1268269 RepID=A0ABV9MZ35_9FLAO
MLDVVFSHSYFYKFDPKQWKNKTPFPPLGTLYAASYLRQNFYNVGLFDTNLIGDLKTLEPYLNQHQPKVFAIYDDGFNYLTKMCLTKMREAAFQMIVIAKKLGCDIIVCSSDATDHYKKYMDAGADFVIQGEGELTLKELIDCLSKGISFSNVQGIVYKNNGSIVINGKRPVLKELDMLPLPAWDLVDISAYKTIWNSGGKEFTLNIVTTRGCPFKCNWCAKPIYGNRYNSHSPAYVANHIDYLQNTYGVSRFWMCDDIFGLKPNWVQDFNRELKKKTLNISFYMQSRVDLLLKEDTIDALHDSGLEEVWVGAESGSQYILDAMDKGTTVDQIFKATKLLKEKHIRVAFFIQFGYLGESKADIEKTITMIKELQPDNIGISISYPLPGTKFYEKVKADLKYKANWTDSDDLAMMFDGTFHSKYYKKLHRYVHQEYRKSLALRNYKKAFSSPLSINKSQIRSMLLIFYYFLSALLYRFQLKNMQPGNVQ